MKGTKMKKKRLKILITLLLILMLGMLSVPFSKYFSIATHSQLMKTETIRTDLPKYVADPEPIQAPRLKDVLKASVNQNKSALGQIVAPSVAVSQPIFVGLTQENMAQGTVSLFPDRNPESHSLTIIGHHVQYDSSLLFGGIQELESDADVYVRYFDNYYAYKVESNRIIRETDLSELQDKGPNYLYLITCNSATETPYRVLVTAKKVTESPVKKVQAAFHEKQNTIQKKQTKTYWLKFLLPLLIVLMLALAFLIYIWRL